MIQQRFTLALFAALCLSLISACESINDVMKSAPKPTARLLGADVRNLSLTSLDLVFDVEISNPYGVSMPLVDLRYALGSGEQQLLSGGIKPSGSVPANGSSVMQLPARLDLAAVLNTLSGVRPGAVVPYQAQIDIIVDAPLLGHLSVPVRHKGEFPVPTIPEVALASLDVDELSLERVSAKARLQVKNTNQFPIDFNTFGFALSLGGKNVANSRLRSSSKLAPGQSATFDVPMSFSPKALGTGILNVISGSSTSYSVAGNLDVNTRFGPLSLPYNQTGKTAITR